MVLVRAGNSVFMFYAHTEDILLHTEKEGETEFDTISRKYFYYIYI